MKISKKIIKGIRVVSNDLRRIASRQTCFYRAKPISAILFLTYRCNSKCKTCSLWKRPVHDEKNREIGFDEWRIIIDKLTGAGVRVAEVYGGNVLLRKDLLIPVLDYLRKKDFIIHLPTNQIGLDDELADAVVRNVNFINFSIDGVGEVHDFVRGYGGAFQNLQSAVERLLRRRKISAVPKLVCNTTVSRYNVGILEKIVRYALKMKFDVIAFEYVGEFSEEMIDKSCIDGLRPTPYFVKGGESVLLDKTGAKQLKLALKKIKNIYGNSDIEIVTMNIDVLSEKDICEGTIPQGKCYIERTEVTVDPSGNVAICPFINNYKTGNLLEGDFEEIWNNERHRRFRGYQNKGAIAMCRHCILGVQRNPGMISSIKRTYKARIEPELDKLLQNVDFL